MYAASRPGYPDVAIDFIVSRCGLGTESILVDVGCGTGISSRMFSDRGIKVIAIEPNKDMREEAELESLANKKLMPAPEYRGGTAEDTGLASDFADVVLSAQAFHWFEPETALLEFHRIVKPGGFVVLMWNERDESDRFSRGYGDLFRKLPETAAVEMKRGSAGAPLLLSPLFHDASKTCFQNEQRMNLDGLLGRAFSASYAPRAGAGADALKAGLIELFHEFEKDGMVALHYETSVFAACK